MVSAVLQSSSSSPSLSNLEALKLSEKITQLLDRVADYFVVSTLDTPVDIGWHRADNYRRTIVCRNCVGTGHRAFECYHHAKDTEPHHRIPLRHGEDERRRDRGERKGDPQNDKVVATVAPVRPEQTSRKRAFPEDGPASLEKKEKTKVQYNVQHISLPLDNNMIKGKEALRSFTIATVTEVRKGFANAQSISEALKEAMEHRRWNWTSKPFLDGRFMVACPTTEKARKLE
ncbi:hypothetical protein J5N97_005641 [Dioscorea zingiberensis]|uniref:Uncharacterized protein n=1 Tax=Dioscorea zingiberensis TaxID=325984 RepID=A0A9D5HS30_9LILI|nr:hypothetical protein J5N97_005641 [Dioscorea zingiberensis]